jgi:hypothetical protein
VYVNAKRIAKLPHIATAVAELRLRYMPAEASMEALYQHGLAVMLELTNSPDSRARFAAAAWLCKEASARKDAAASTAALEQQRLLESLRELYRKITALTAANDQFVGEGDEGEAEGVASGAAEGSIGAAAATAELDGISEMPLAGDGTCSAAREDPAVFTPGRFPPQRIRLR